MSRTRRFLGGVSFGYAQQAAVTLVGLWLTPFLLWRLGAHEYGLWLAATQIIAYLTLFDLGVLALLPRETAYATGRSGGLQRTTGLPDVIGRTARIVLWQIPLIAAATAAAWWLLPADWAGLRTPLAWLLLAFVITYPLRICQATLQGLQDLAFLGALQLSAWASGTALTVYLVLSGWDLRALAAGAVVTQAVSLGGAAFRLIARFPGAVPGRLPSVPWRDAKPYVQRALWVSVSQIAQVLLYATDLLIVAWIFGPVAVVPYACTQKLISVLANQPQVLTQAAAPALAELRIGSSRGKLFSVTSSLSLAVMILSGAVVAVVLATNRGFVTWWVGADQYGGALLTALFAAAMLARHFNTALVYSLFSFGHERRLSLTSLADGAVTIGLALMFAHMFGAAGVPLGFLGGAVLVSLPANLTALSREAGVSPLHFLSTLAPWAVRLAPVVVVAAAFHVLLRPASAGAVLFAGAVIGTVYGALMLPLALRSSLGGYIRAALAPVIRLPAPHAVAEPAVVAREHGQHV